MKHDMVLKRSGLNVYPTWQIHCSCGEWAAPLLTYGSQKKFWEKHVKEETDDAIKRNPNPS